MADLLTPLDAYIAALTDAHRASAFVDTAVLEGRIGRNLVQGAVGREIESMLLARIGKGEINTFPPSVDSDPVPFRSMLKKAS